MTTPEVGAASTSPPKPISLFVGLPCFGGMLHAPCARSLLGLQQECIARGIPLEIDFVLSESLIPRARNHLVARFLASGRSHLFFLDADIVFEPRYVLEMLAAQKPVVCAAYPKKAIDWKRVTSAVQSGKDPAGYAASYAINPAVPPTATPTPDGKGVTARYQSDKGCVPILDAATGFLLIERDAILDMIEAHPETRYRSDCPEDYGQPRWALFDCVIEPGTLRYLSEDYTFSRRWQKMGGTVWLYLGAQLGHIGNHTFRGDIFSVYEPDDRPELPAPLAKALAELDPGARQDLEAVLDGSYDIPGLEGVELVLDIGANIGAFSWWAKQRWPTASIIAFEPHPDNMQSLKAVRRCSTAAMVICEAALSDRDGREFLRDGLHNNGCASLYDLGQQAAGGRVVDCVDAADTHMVDPNFVKVDTEGCELMILRRLDLSKTLGVAYEWHSAEDRRSLADLMRESGFVLHSEQPGPRDTGVAKWVRA